ncbi:hypothetical protein FDP41_008953 [Naegleria fowleri]|uniref:Serine/threonine-protein kinase RIO2 n=1 Tax=Naegleria fowleri TaxID=5763 RepID=A0A6A5BF91_NAEFO|nr:uncharacterized protein FDP41_008953 [Naegleria fowleri]KAF0972704.1 hypothetical protein FDP41_008953 [Naegleria fowleri]CAG4709998.1 unnamed protein product [Naegleria fowleri]
MVKIDSNKFRYLSNDDFRVLTAIEMGMKNHELVPTPLIERIAGLRHGGTQKVLSHLLKYKLVHHDAKNYDGYHLTYPGYDFLSLKTFMKRGHVIGFGRQIGVGKESDIYLLLSPVKEGEEEETKDEEDGEENIVLEKTTEEIEQFDEDDEEDEEDEDEKEDEFDGYDLEHKAKQIVIKFHRLGRSSFRAVKNTRDYLGKRSKTTNWLYMSRLSALKEFAFMKAIYDTKCIPVPKPIDCNRHCVLMEHIKGYPLYQIREMKHPLYVYEQCVDLLVKLAQYGLVHGDFNEFNLLVKPKSEKVVVIDFPQMVSTSHPNAEFYFNRDLDCISSFFAKRFSIVIKPEDEEYSRFHPKLSDITKEYSLDVHVEASGFTKEKAKEFDEILKEKEQEENEESQIVNGESTTEQPQEGQITEEKPNDEETQVISDEESPSVVTGTSTTTARRKKKKTITEEDIKEKVKRDFKKKQYSRAKDIQTAKRNAQKGRDTQKLKQKVKDFDY